jgi:hypothetical protein
MGRPVFCEKAETIQREGVENVKKAHADEQFGFFVDNRLIIAVSGT